jgi:glutathione S-transferase
MTDKITFYSLREGPNPWKTVTVLEELGLSYETIFLEFGKAPNGVEGKDFIKKNPAGRVPLIYDPRTGKLSNWYPSPKTC